MSRPADNRAQFQPDDHPNEHFLLTTVVGSYPKPKWLNRAEIGRASCRERVFRAV